MTSPPTADERVVVVGDAHLGSGDVRDEAAFHEFLDAVPQLGKRLLIMGDLFDFWFEYRAVIPRRPFKTLAQLAGLVERGVRVEMVGGNHDRWGGTFWAEDLGIPFSSEGMETTLAGRQTWIHHGDGLAERKLGGRLIHAITRNPITIGVFKILHPDVGFWLVRMLSGGLADRSTENVAEWSEAQEEYARAFMHRRPELKLVVMAHTHRQRLLEVEPGRFYLNAGQWMEDRHYAVVTAKDIKLLRWPSLP
ncbi:MAG: UDP-2,3-diacylglucosamine diphosphatase [Gemmatimonadales bacterium]